jgi:DegV family protein with EDD domain
MSSICVVTDSSAQFPRPIYPAQKKIEIVPLICQLNGNDYVNGKGLTLADMPGTALNGNNPQLLPPSVDHFYEVFYRLGQKFDAIIGVFLSSQLNPCVQNAQTAATILSGKSSIQIIDSQTTSVGLGYLTQIAFEAVEAGCTPVDIERKLRYLIPFIYTVFCIPGISYLYYNHFVDKGQAVVSELLGLYPIFALENGKLTSLEKVRNHRQALVFFQEFLDEFEQTEHIALIRDTHVAAGDMHLNHEPPPGINKSNVQEYNLSLPLATLIGPTAIGLSVIETADQKKR